MPGSSKSIDGDDNVARLMPNVAKLIRVDSDSLESKGSTSMSLCGTSGKDKIEAQNAKPSCQRRAEAVLQDVANKFLRRGAAGKRSVGACTPPTVDMLSSCHRLGSSSANWRNVCMNEKENLRPEASTLVKQGKLQRIQQIMTMRNTSQITGREFRKNPSHSLVKLGQRRTTNPKGADKSFTGKVPVLDKHAPTATSPKSARISQGSEGSRHVSNLAAKNRRGKGNLYTKTTPLSLSELQEKFAELDGEALEEEEVSLAHLTIAKPVLASKTVLQNAENVAENRDLSRCGQKDDVSVALTPNFEEATVPKCLWEQGQEGIGICTNQSKLSKTPDRGQHTQVSETICKGNARGNLAASPGTDCDSVTRPERQPSQHPDGHEQHKLERRNGEYSPRFEDSSNPFVNGTENKARTAEMKTSPIPLDASPQEFSGKVRHVCAVSELEHAENSGNDKRGYSSLKPTEENFKEMTADGADAHASHREDTALGHPSTLREDVQSSPLKAERLLEQDGAPGVANREGNCSTRDTSATPARDPLLLTCLHYSRIGRGTDMSKRRLVFDSSSDSPSRQKVVNRNSADSSVSTVEFKGRTNPAIDVLNPHVRENDASMTSVPHQEATLPFTDDEVICPVDERGCTSQSPKPKAATHYEDAVEREPPLIVSLAQDDNLPEIEASRGVVEPDAGIHCPGLQAGPATEVPKVRGLGKRTWANLGDRIDGGTEWRQGRRVSTRIKSRPLDWWRGERMLYGRVHSTLCTLIGIKTTTPDPIWPRPKPQRGDYTITNFHVDSFVGENHRDLLRLAAQ